VVDTGHNPLFFRNPKPPPLFCPKGFLVFAIGPLAATGSQTSGRFPVSTKSPSRAPSWTTTPVAWGMRFRRLWRPGHSRASERAY